MLKSQHRHGFVSVLALVALLALVASCGMGLSPAGSGSGTVISLSLGPSLPLGRAIMPGGGYLYFRAWPDAIGSACSVYGPYAVSAGDQFETAEIPGRKYAALDVILSSSAIPLGELAGTTDFAELTVAAEGVASSYRVENAEIIPNRINVLDVTLVPLVGPSCVATLNPLLYTATISRSYGSVGKIARYFRIDGLPTLVATDRLSFKATATDGSVSLVLYRADGNPERGLAFDAESLEWRLQDPADLSYYLLVTGEASAFEIAVQAVPETVQAGVTISFGNPSVPTVTGSGAEVTSLDTITVTASSGFAEYAWALNGNSIAGATTNVCAIDLKTATGAIVGDNVVTLKVKTTAGEYYSASFTFKMSE